MRLPPHSHCVVCEEPIDEGETYCSEACRAEDEARIERERKRGWLFYAVVIVIAVVMMSLPLIL